MVFITAGYIFQLHKKYAQNQSSSECTDGSKQNEIMQFSPAIEAMETAISRSMRRDTLHTSDRSLLDVIKVFPLIGLPSV
jgi:hypothetical protein